MKPQSPAASPAADGLCWRAVFPGEEREIGQARRWLTGLLPGCPARDDVITVAVELCTNAVKHSDSSRGGYLAIEVTWHRAMVRVAVADGGGPEGPRPVDDPMAEHGRGLQIVGALSARYGVSGDHRGRLVWADVPWTGPQAAAPAGYGEGYEAAIRDGEAALARRHTGVLAWFGRSTLQWWALPVPGGRLLTAPSASELASLLDHALPASRTRYGPPGRPRSAQVGRRADASLRVASRQRPALVRRAAASAT